MDWHLLCSACSCVVESFRTLRGVHNQFHCNVCTMDYEASLDDLISVTFTINPQIRDIPLHHPERLSAWDYFFKLGGTIDGCLPDGTPFVKIVQSLARAVTYLTPGETTLEVRRAGRVGGGSFDGTPDFYITVDPALRLAPRHPDRIRCDSR